MSDMLVKLYDLKMTSRQLELESEGILIKQAMGLDRKKIIQFVSDHFKDICEGWTDECDLAIMQHPSSCFIAAHNKEIVGFACYDATARGMLGPLGVRKEYRARGIAKELIYQCLIAMKHAGYAYAVIGWVSSEEYYAKTCGAITIPDSFPGIYSRMISVD